MVDAIGYNYGNYGAYDTPVQTDPTQCKNAKAARASVNFEGKYQNDTFESSKKSHTARNVAVGSGIVLAGLYVLAALAGRGKGLTGKGSAFAFGGENIFSKAGNWCIKNSHDSAKWIKNNTYDRVAGLFKKKGDTKVDS